MPSLQIQGTSSDEAPSTSNILQADALSLEMCFGFAECCLTRRNG